MLEHILCILYTENSSVAGDSAPSVPAGGTALLMEATEGFGFAVVGAIACLVTASTAILARGRGHH